MQKLKTRVVKKNINPEWNEDLTLSIADPSVPIKLVSVIVLVTLEAYSSIKRTSRIIMVLKPAVNENAWLISV
jgi:Ca2+-dependent lipid-binding protein